MRKLLFVFLLIFIAGSVYAQSGSRTDVNRELEKMRIGDRARQGGYTPPITAPTYSGGSGYQNSAQPTTITDEEFENILKMMEENPAISAAMVNAMFILTPEQKKKLGIKTPEEEKAAKEAEAERLSSSVIGQGSTIIKASAFKDKGLTNATIANTVTSIGHSAFKDNQLRSITIPNSVRNIGGEAFWGNPMYSITIGAGVNLHLPLVPGGRIISDSFQNSFDDFYYGNGRKAGTYTYGVDTSGRKYAWSFAEATR